MLFWPHGVGMHLPSKKTALLIFPGRNILLVADQTASESVQGPFVAPVQVLTESSDMSI